MKKVLFINPYIPTLGGGEKHMAYMCQFIENYYNLDVKIDILVHDYNDIKIDDTNYITVDDINKQFGMKLQCTHIRKLKLKPARNFFERRRNRLIITNITKEYDLMVNFKFMSNEVGKAKVNLYGCMFPVERLAKSRALWKKPYAMIRDKQFYDSYDCFIANSQYTFKWIEKYWKKDSKNCVIYPPVFSKNDIEGRYDESKKQNIILSVGRFFVGGHCKKQVDMVKFFINNKDKFKKYEYHLVGACSNDSRDLAYLNKIKRLASTVDNVFVHENYPFDKLIDLYTKAKIFWHGTGFASDDERQPQNMEHFGITTVEAMSYGAVPVVIRKGGQTETVKEGVNGYLWENEKECVTKTMKIVQDDNLRKKLALESAKMANDYSIETFYERNEELFHELHL